jgi:hypothetical protein
VPPSSAPRRSPDSRLQSGCALPSVTFLTSELRRSGPLVCEEPAQNHPIAQGGTWRTSNQISTLRARCSSIVGAPIGPYCTGERPPRRRQAGARRSRMKPLPAKPVCEVPIAAIAAALGALCDELTVAVPLLARQGKLRHLLLLRHSGLAQTSEHVGVVFGPMPRYAPTNKCVERGRRDRNSFFERRLRCLHATQLPKGRGEPAVGRREVGV